jgi:hypothetical protein
MTLLRMVSFMLIVCILGAHSQTNSAAAPRNVTEVFDTTVDATERATMAMANAMPEDHYSFRPTKGEFKGVRTFVQLASGFSKRNSVPGPVTRKVMQL